jgi:cobaltochelatase CobS
MALIKHDYPGVRTVRKACRDCGSTDLYWAHDTDMSARQGKYACDKTECPGNGSYQWTHINRDGSRHDCQGKAGQAHSEPEPAESAPEPVTPVQPSPVSVPPAPVTAPAATDPAMAAFQAFMAAVAPKVDATQVHAIVDERLRGLVLPVQVEVKRDGVVRKIEGLAHKALATVIKRLNRKHVLMVGPAGTGKSHIAHQAADALGFDFYSISLTPQTPASAITGYMSATALGQSSTSFPSCSRPGVANRFVTLWLTGSLAERLARWKSGAASAMPTGARFPMGHHVFSTADDRHVLTGVTVVECAKHANERGDR